MQNPQDNRRPNRSVRWVIRHAVSTLPADLAARLQEEWLADAAERGSDSAQWRFALGCYWAGMVIGRQYGMKLATVAPTHDSTSSGFARHERPQLRPLAIVAVVLLHLGVAYALLHGLTAHTAAHQKRPDNLVNQPMTPEKPRPAETFKPTSTPRPDFLSHFEPRLPPLDLPEDPPDQHGQPQADLHAHDLGPDANKTAAAAAPTRLEGGPGVGFPNPNDFYPSMARLRGEQGLSTVQVCVDKAGRLTGTPTLLSSSGSARLDTGALQLAVSASGHYRPTTEDDKPITACYPLRIRFQIKD